MLQCVTVCCSVLQGVAGCCSVLPCDKGVAGCCRLLQCVALREFVQKTALAVTRNVCRKTEHVIRDRSM